MEMKQEKIQTKQNQNKRIDRMNKRNILKRTRIEDVKETHLLITLFEVETRTN